MPFSLYPTCTPFNYPPYPPPLPPPYPPPTPPPYPHPPKMLLSPYIYLEAKVLPVYHPSAAEKADAELMAENVRVMMANELEAPLSPYGARELRKEWQAQAAKKAE